jgi:UDPglucose 6-dehydrogenase
VLSVFDPVAMENGRQALEEVQWCPDAYSAAVGADAVVILTEWNVFRGLDLRRLARDMREPLMIDFRNLFTRADMVGTGLTYHSIGRASYSPLSGSMADVVSLEADAA